VTSVPYSFRSQIAKVERLETVRKGFEGRYKGEFGRYAEDKMDRKAPFFDGSRATRRRVQGFSDSFSYLDFIHSGRIAKRFG
jgi:hypothetical protein